MLFSFPRLTQFPTCSSFAEWSGGKWSYLILAGMEATAVLLIFTLGSLHPRQMSSMLQNAFQVRDLIEQPLAICNSLYQYTGYFRFGINVRQESDIVLS